MLGEVIPDRVLLGSMSNLVSLRMDLIPRLAIVRALTRFEYGAFLKNTPFNIKFCEAHGIPLDDDDDDCEKKSENSHVFEIDIDDHPGADIETRFADAADFIERSLRDGKLVVIHCNAGQSRSAAITIAFLVLKESLTLRAAVEKVKRARPWCCPNFGFCERLIELEKHVLERQQSAKHGDDDDDDDDADRHDIVTPSFSGVEQFQHFVKLVGEQVVASKAECLNALKRVQAKYCEISGATQNNVGVDDDDDDELLLDRVNFQVMAQMRAAVLPDDAVWCPPPVTVGIDDFFRLSNVDVAVAGAHANTRANNANEEDDAVARYRAQVAEAERDLELEQLRMDTGGAAADREWEKLLEVDDDDDDDFGMEDRE